MSEPRDEMALGKKAVGSFYIKGTKNFNA